MKKNILLWILGTTAKLGWIVVTILNLIDGKYLIAIGFFCLGLVFFFPQWYKKNQP
tara:strand:+ start:89 stop:256 length:168 start_codon:yes stop_codon:yes gene_type:complete